MISFLLFFFLQTKGPVVPEEVVVGRFQRPSEQLTIRRNKTNRLMAVLATRTATYKGAMEAMPEGTFAVTLTDGRTAMRCRMYRDTTGNVVVQVFDGSGRVANQTTFSPAIDVTAAPVDPIVRQ